MRYFLTIGFILTALSSSCRQSQKKVLPSSLQDPASASDSSKDPALLAASQGEWNPCEKFEDPSECIFSEQYIDEDEALIIVLNSD